MNKQNPIAQLAEILNRPLDRELERDGDGIAVRERRHGVDLLKGGLNCMIYKLPGLDFFHIRLEGWHEGELRSANMDKGVGLEESAKIGREWLLAEVAKRAAKQGAGK